MRGRSRHADQEHHRRRWRRADDRPAIPRPRLQERPGRRARGVRPALTPIEVAQLHDHATLAKTLAQEPATLTPGQRNDLFDYYLANFDAEYRARLAALTELRKQRSSLIDPVAEIMVMKELPQPRPTFILRRGAYDAPTDPVAAIRQPLCCRSHVIGRATGSGWRAGSLTRSSP